MRTPRSVLSTVLAAALAFGAATACGAQAGPPRPVHTGTVNASPAPDPDAPLTATEWTVESLARGGAVSPLPAGAAGRARFALAPDGSASGVLGCNRFTARATVDGASLTFGPLASTRMACTGPAGEVERALTGLFASGPLDWRIRADTLTLTGRDGSGDGLTAKAASAAE